MTEELWKPIPTYPTYEASNLGRVRNKNTNVILRPNKNSKGYRHVVLYRGCKKDKHMVGVHRAVAMAWIPTDDFSLTVNHKDENKDNNTVENLEWMTNTDNVIYSQGRRVMCVETGKIYPCIAEAVRDTGLSFHTIKSSIENSYVRTKRCKLSFKEV